MANVTKFQTPTARVRRAPGEFNTGFAFDLAVVANDALQNDVIILFVPPVGARFTACQIAHDATLGAAATAQLRMGTVALTAATVAGGASSIMQNASNLPADGILTLNILIAGAAIGATTNLRVVGIMTMPNG